MEEYETENNDKTEEEVSDSGDSTGSTTESDNSDMEMDSANYDEDPFAWDVQVGDKWRRWNFISDGLHKDLYFIHSWKCDVWLITYV